jgi:protein tyrosine phosphatase (PTP) superfamily phosphohydrolase (DUF442 family)
MNWIRYFLLLGVLAAVGCQSTQPRPKSLPPGAVYQLPPGATVKPSNDVLVPAPLPPGGTFAPGGVRNGSNYVAPPPAPRPDLGPGAKLTAPQPGPAVRLLPPEVPAAPAAPAEPTPQVSLPVGIAQFAEVAPGVTTGLRPTTEGWDWLRTQKYRTVLFVRAPGTDDRSERTAAAGLDFRTLDVSAEGLTLDVVRQFSQQVRDPQLQPLFVYDSRGWLAGGMWYLHLRTAEKLDDAAARQKAAALGYRPSAEPDQRTFELAIQRLLSTLTQ